MAAAASSSVPQPGGQAQLAFHCPHRSARHISRTSCRGVSAFMSTGAAWENPFSAASVISFVLMANPLDKAAPG